MTNFTNEQANLGYSLVSPVEFSEEFKAYKEIGSERMSDILSNESIALVFTREYEHAVGCMSSGDKLKIDYFSLPHPSGIAVSENRIFVFSTRTPHMLLEFKKRYRSRSHDKSTYLIPEFIRVLPGSLYAHEMLEHDGYLYFNATGHNDVRRISSSLKGPVDTIYKPSFIQMNRGNCMQLNSLAIAENGDAFSTCFSASDSDYKPWKDSEGPRGKGAILRHSDSMILLGDLTCPHSIRVVDGKLYFCNSGFGQLNSCNVDGTDHAVMATFPGFTRGLAFSKNYVFIGLSRVQRDKSSYAPGINSTSSLCGIAAICRHTGQCTCLLSWPNGEQIFDIQILHNKDYQYPRFPQSRDSGSADPSELFYNWQETL